MSLLLLFNGVTDTAPPEPPLPERARIKLRRATVAVAGKQNQVLFAGEVMFDKETSEYVVGDGVRTWAQLMRPMVKQQQQTFPSLANQLYNYDNYEGGM